MNNEVSSDFSSISPTLPSNPTTTFLMSKSHKESESKEHQEDIFDSLLRENNSLLFSQEIDTKIKLDSESLFQTTSEQIYTEIIDDVIFGLLLQVHRASKLGYLFILDPEVSPEFDKQYEIYDKNDVLGVFSNLNETYKSSGNGGRNGHSASSVNNHLLKYECNCPNCGRSLAAIRFAPHLEKCMGMGRNSSRIATRRIANYNGDELDQLIEQTGLLPNRYVEQPRASSVSNVNSNSNNNNTATTNNDDLMSIINAVATANTQPENGNSTFNFLSINNSSSDSNFSSYSNSFSGSNSLKPPNAKKKRIQNSKSLNPSSNMTKPIAHAQVQINICQENTTTLIPNPNSASN